MTEGKRGFLFRNLRKAATGRMTMRIAMMTNNYKPFVAGVAVSVERLADSLREAGHEVVVFAPDYDGQPKEENVVRYGALI